MFAAAPVEAPPLVDREFARDVEKGLGRKGQKTLPPSWFYDELGSALFEAITVLPEYGLTRAESRLLTGAARSIVREAGSPGLVVELGSGSGSKTRMILAAGGDVTYRPIDISAAALTACGAAMAGLANVEVEPVEATYDDGLSRALCDREDDEHALLLFLGSTIGNFSRTEAVAFLRKLRGSARPGDSFLLGADLLKDREILTLAYDDPAGVTAAFNKNILGRINRELDGSFNLACFQHEARFNEKRSRVEMHLRSLAEQSIRIGALDMTVKFREGETIWTESSHKFKAEDVVDMGERAGWRCVKQWIDREWGFAETLFAF